MDVYAFRPGDVPVLVSIPHGGTWIPPEIAERMTEAGRGVPDTDWHLGRLYDFAPGLGVGVIAATHSRYVVDLNRDPAGRALYPGADNTELCPTTTFDRAPIYLPGAAPDEAEVARRTAAYWRPYHDRLAAELAALRERFGIAVLFDAHSIRSEVPRFFEGRLPDFNFGTADGASAAPELAARLIQTVEDARRYSSVLNGRFKGGYITRHHGRPSTGVHAVQLELSEATYMDEDPPYTYREDLAARVRPVLERLVAELVAWTRRPER